MLALFRLGLRSISTLLRRIEKLLPTAFQCVFIFYLIGTGHLPILPEQTAAVCAIHSLYTHVHRNSAIFDSRTAHILPPHS